jgi:hypothetical protein
MMMGLSALTSCDCLQNQLDHRRGFAGAWRPVDERDVARVQGKRHRFYLGLV